MTFKEKVKAMDMKTILRFAQIGYMFMQYRKENKTDEILQLNLLNEVEL